MKNVTFVVVAVVLMLSGITLAQQSREEKKDSSMKGMMQEMMKEKQSSEGSTHGMGGMGDMMGMMKMMEQCSKMMESAHDKAKDSGETHSKSIPDGDHHDGRTGGGGMMGKGMGEMMKGMMGK